LDRGGRRLRQSGPEELDLVLHVLELAIEDAFLVLLLAGVFETRRRKLRDSSFQPFDFSISAMMSASGLLHLAQKSLRFFLDVPFVPTTLIIAPMGL